MPFPIRRRRSPGLVFGGVVLAVGVLGAAFGRPAAAGPREDAQCAHLVTLGLASLREGEVAQGKGDETRARGHFAAAADKFDSARRLCPTDTDPPFWLGITRVMNGEPDAYAHAFAALRAIAHDDDPRVEYLAAFFSLKLGARPDLAIQGFDRVRARQPAFLPEQLRILLWQSLMEAAAQSVSHAIDTRAQAQSGVFNRAIKWLRRAVQEAGSSSAKLYQARRNLAQVHRLANEFVPAQKILEMLLATHAHDAVVHYGLATVLADQLQYDKAVPHWEECLRLKEAGSYHRNEPTSMEDARMRYGRTLHLAGRKEEARVQLERFVREAPDDPRGHYYLGLLEAETPMAVLLQSLPVEDAARRRALDVVSDLLGKPAVEVESLVKTLPAVLRTKASEEWADRAQDRLEGAGATVRLRPDFGPAIALFEEARRLAPDCEDATRELLKIYSGPQPDPARAAELEAWLNDETQKKLREAVRAKKISKRADRTEGCR